MSSKTWDDYKNAFQSGYDHVMSLKPGDPWTTMQKEATRHHGNYPGRGAFIEGMERAMEKNSRYPVVDDTTNTIVYFAPDQAAALLEVTHAP